MISDRQLRGGASSRVPRGQPIVSRCVALCRRQNGLHDSPSPLAEPFGGRRGPFRFARKIRELASIRDEVSSPPMPPALARTALSRDLSRISLAVFSWEVLERGGDKAATDRCKGAA